MSVYGTGRPRLRHRLRIFSGACSSVTVTCPEGLAYFPASPDTLPPCPLATSVQRAIRSARGPFASPSPFRLTAAGLRNIDRMSIRQVLRTDVRPRLTLNRLALFRNPWSSGEGVSRPLCRYLCLHLLFRLLQHASRHAFAGGRNAPLPINLFSNLSHGFGTGLMPDYYPRGAARLVSCYALFK